ncbi:MAG: UDP-N-acetylmuramoyl-tripeptide--D-alanyl-D-alanine ligase [Candidatus Gastranaerophilales bacterium]|nr:UDP-N-acetylmuramoyl-tripeptide--D-alanyl-D-alanine ligase [Candidatus Gastranaerophilales bacterium]
MKFSLDDIVKITKAKVLYSTNPSGMFSFSTDTRNISPEQIYIPIRGENFDGHDFIGAAIEKSARGFFIESSHVTHLESLPKAKFALEVPDTKEAYLALASHYRDQVSPIVIGITGSSGKTTVKEMISIVLSKRYKVHKTKLNHNNEIGLAQTIFEMPQDTEILVAEMGMRGLGEIEFLAKYAKPDIAVITNIGLAHIGRLGSQENIAKAKCEITKYLHEEGLLIACDNELIRKYADVKNKIYYSLENSKLKNIEKSSNSVSFEYKKHKYTLNVLGDYNILNALSAIETGQKLGVPDSKIAEALREYAPMDNRGATVEVGNFTVLTDYYNANPESMKASIQAALDAYGEVSLLLGDMGELGDKEVCYHRELGRFLKGKKIKKLITVGSLAANIAKSSKLDDVKVFKDTKEVAEYLKNIEEKTVLLMKASRSMKFENILEELKGLIA